MRRELYRLDMLARINFADVAEELRMSLDDRELLHEMWR